MTVTFHEPGCPVCGDYGIAGDGTRCGCTHPFIVRLRRNGWWVSRSNGRWWLWRIVDETDDEGVVLADKPVGGWWTLTDATDSLLGAAT